MGDSSDALKQIAFEMIRSGAPEREAELVQMWKTHTPRFIYSGDKPNFVLEAGAFQSLRLTDRTLRLIWMFGHIVWKTMSLYSGVIHVYSMNNALFKAEDIETDPDHKQTNSEIKVLLDKFHELKSVESIADYNWPSSIPPPAHLRPTHDDEQTAVFDLVGLAMVYAFLHELRHIQISDDPDISPDSSIAEELMCDQYARSFLLEKIEQYSTLTGEDSNKVTSKRTMAIALASFLIFELTPETAWRGTKTHPSINERLKHIMDFPSLHEDDNYWLYLGSILITKIRLMSVNLPAIQFSTKRSFCQKLFEVFSNYVKQPASGYD